MNNDKIPGYVETIDSHLYCVVVAKRYEYENENELIVTFGMTRMMILKKTI